MQKKFLTVGAIFLLSACATETSLNIVETSSVSAPEWIGRETMYPCNFEKGKGYIAVAENGKYICSVKKLTKIVNNKKDEAVFLKKASQTAQKDLTQEIKQKMANTYNTVSAESSVPADEKQKSLRTFLNATVSGLKIGGTYWETVSEKTGDTSVLKMNSYSLGVISKAHYTQAFNNQKKTFSNQAEELNRKTIDTAFSGK